MRIVCQKCSAAYAIDDKVITPRGVRAQCPRCRHLQLVKREGEAGAPVAAQAPGRQPPPPLPAREAVDLFDAAFGASPPPGGGLELDLGGSAHAGGAPGCQLCGAPLLEPAARAQGTCDVCRRAQGLSAPRAERLPPAPARPPPVAAEPRREPLAPPPVPQARPQPAPRRSRAGLVAVAGGAVAVLAAGAGVLAWRRPAPVAPPPSTAAPAAPAPALQQAVARWRLSFVGLRGSAAEQVAQGQAQLALDTHAGALAAEEHFQRALVLEPGNEAALTGYLEALALGRAGRAEAPVLKEAEALAEAGLSRSGRAPALLVAYAHLLLARPPDEATAGRAGALAAEALASKDVRVQAEAHRVLAQLKLGTSVALAAEHLETARALQPETGRALFLRAQTLAADGRYAEALELLEARVAQDPGHWEALALLVRLRQELGQTAQARAALQAQRPAGGLEVERALAVLLYQGEGARPREAVQVLRALLEHRERYAAPEVAELLVHLAAAERAAGNPGPARKAAEEALAAAPGDASAHLQLLMLALARRDAAAAATHLQGVAGRLGDAGLEALLEGRVRVLEGKPEEAVERFLEAVRRDPRRLDAQLWAGAAAAAAGRRADAFRLLLEAQGRVPAPVAPPTGSPRLSLRPGETLAGAEGRVLKLATGADVVPARLYEALVRYHQGDLEAADRLARAVLDADTNNATALALRSLTALARGNRAAALKLGAQAGRQGRQLALAQYAWGQALAASGDALAALTAMREALELAPGLATLAVRVAELEAATGARDAARERLHKVVARDGADVAARRALYAVDRRG